LKRHEEETEASKTQRIMRQPRRQRAISIWQHRCPIPRAESTQPGLAVVLSAER